MDKFLSIIIPRYNEDMDMVRCVVSSICFQANIDKDALEVILVDDNPEAPLSANEVVLLGGVLRLDVRYSAMETNGGPGVARQKGIDMASGKYIMFMDCDDCFSSPSSLWHMFNTIKKNPKTEYLQSFMLEEYYDEAEEEYSYITHEFENTWVFGKMFKKSFLTENNIRFHEELRLHEDTYFLMLVAAAAKERMILNTPTYVWKCNKASITRGEPNFIEKHLHTFIHSTMLAVDELGRLNPEKKPRQLAQNLCTFYFMLQQDSWLEDDVKEYRELCIETLKKEMESRWEIYESVPQDYIRQVYNVERAEHFKNGEMELYSLNEWVRMLKG